MIAAAGTHPGYGFERNKGYASFEHRLAVARLGTTPIHRLSWSVAPVGRVGEVSCHRRPRRRRSAASGYNGPKWFFVLAVLAAVANAFATVLQRLGVEEARPVSKRSRHLMASISEAADLVRGPRPDDGEFRPPGARPELREPVDRAADHGHRDRLPRHHPRHLVPPPAAVDRLGRRVRDRRRPRACSWRSATPRRATAPRRSTTGCCCSSPRSAPSRWASSPPSGVPVPGGRLVTA